MAMQHSSPGASSHGVYRHIQQSALQADASAILRPAIFVMRDRLICEEQPGCVLTGEPLRLATGAGEALRLLARLDMPIVLLMDAACVSHSECAAQTLAWRHQQLMDSIAAQGGRCDAMFICAHWPHEECACHAPQTGLLTSAAQTLHLDLPRSALICDTWEHAFAALSVRCQPLLTLTERGRIEIQYPMWAQARERVWYAADVVGAAQSIEATVVGQRLWQTLQEGHQGAGVQAGNWADNAAPLGSSSSFGR